MLRTVLIIFLCAFALSPLRAQDAPTSGSALSGPLPGNTAPALGDTASSTHTVRELWRRKMAQKHAPKSGCYSTKYPSTEWVETPCSTAAPRPHAPSAAHGSATAGSGNSPLASTTDPITSATGELAQVNGVTRESDPTGADTWSLQLNANTFKSPACKGQDSCMGWEQFIVDNPVNVYIQYWLLNHTSPCPAVPDGLSGSWTFSPASPGQAPGCYMNGNQTSVPTQGSDRLQGLRVTGNSSNIAQSVIYETADGQLFTSTDDGDPLSIALKWSQAEFNIFGQFSGAQAIFNTGVSILVQIGVDYGGELPPTCKTGSGFTAENNNLNLILPCAGYAGKSGVSIPGVQFLEDLVSPIPGCVYPDATAACAQLPKSNFTDADFTSACPAGGATLKVLSDAAWKALPLHCSDGKMAGSCGPGATVANQFVLGTQRYGTVWSGAPIGSSQTVEACDTVSNCSRFALRIPDCPPAIAADDVFKLSDGNNPLNVLASGTSDANLILDGPWVSSDHGVGATGATSDATSLPSGMVVSLSPGISGAPHTYATMDVSVQAPPNTPPGDYHLQVSATDRVSKVTLKTGVPLRVLACVPQKTCSSSLLNLCGLVSDGCGGSADCGACTTGVCSNGVCCPAGNFFNTSFNGCQPVSCPSGQVFCQANGSCSSTKDCDHATTPICHKNPIGEVICE